MGLSRYHVSSINCRSRISAQWFGLWGVKVEPAKSHTSYRLLASLFFTPIILPAYNLCNSYIAPFTELSLQQFMGASQERALGAVAIYWTCKGILGIIVRDYFEKYAECRSRQQGRGSRKQTATLTFSQKPTPRIL